jgi:hypothetical protein
MEKLSSKHY